MYNNSRKRSLETSLKGRSEKRCRFDEDMMESEDLTTEIEETEPDAVVETDPSVEDFIPKISCAEYIRHTQDINFVSTVNNSVHEKLVNAFREVGLAIKNCCVVKLNIQELAKFWFLVDSIHRNLQIMVPSNGVEEYDAQKLIILAQCFNLCAGFLGMVGWINITDMELRSFRAPENRYLICEMQEHMKQMSCEFNNFKRSLAKTEKDGLKQGYYQLYNDERKFLTKH